MNGPLVLNADPTIGLGAATKQYVDNAVSQVIVGIIATDLVTTNAADTLVDALPVIPSAGGYALLQGTIVAQIQSTRVLTVWNIALAVYRVGNAMNCTVAGDTTPSIFTQDASMVDCAVTLAAGTQGPTITLNGLAGTDISWGVNLNSTTGD